jgi:phosphoenolpyruvate carboxykinase (GTP)
MPGWKVWTLGDDIAWLDPGEDGTLRAINPEAGYFGVVPGTNRETNRNAYDMIAKNTIFTNVALTADNEPWWEDKDVGEPATDWKGNPYTGEGPAAHPNSRFTVSATQNPSYSSLAEAPEGVPISAIVFGGRRRELAPLVFQAKDWNHGVLVGASVASEMTAAAAGKLGEVRRDPMAMKPFCGYNFADYFAHWLSFGGNELKLPKVFHVNWFRRDGDGRFLWPGFGENLRVLSWIIDAKARAMPSRHRSATCRKPTASTSMASTSRRKRWPNCSPSITQAGGKRWNRCASIYPNTAIACRQRCRPSSTRCSTPSSNWGQTPFLVADSFRS